MIEFRHPVVDPSVSEAIVEATPEWVGILLVPLTYLGSVFVLLPLVVLAFWWAPRRFGTWLPAFLAYYGVMGGIKSLNDATRPDVEAPVSEAAFPAAYAEWYEHATAIGTTSFPSGNAMAATLVVSLLVVDLEVSTFRRRAVVGAVLILLVAYTRLGLGVHYPVDVVAGMALGLALCLVVIVARDRAEDGVSAAFGVAIVTMAVGLWLASNEVGVPSVPDLEGSLRVIAFGGAVGGYASWRALRNGWWRERRLAVPAIAVIVLPLTALQIVVGYPLVTMVWAAAVFAAIVAVPVFTPDRAGVQALLERRRLRGT